jgi:hypothetical protein
LETDWSAHYAGMMEHAIDPIRSQESRSWSEGRAGHEDCRHGGRRRRQQLEGAARILLDAVSEPIPNTPAHVRPFVSTTASTTTDRRERARDPSPAAGA